MMVYARRQACAGHGQCAAVDEADFPLDEDGYTAITELGVEIPAGQEELARGAVESCPMRALRYVMGA